MGCVSRVLPPEGSTLIEVGRAELQNTTAWRIAAFCCIVLPGLLQEAIREWGKKSVDGNLRRR